MTYIKNHDSWNKIKKHLDGNGQPPTYQAREVWWCSIGINIGHEEDGKNEFSSRPVLIIRKFNKQMFFGLPLTTKIKEHSNYLKIDFHGKEQCVMLSQLRSYDSKRLTKRMGKISNHQFEIVLNKLIDTIKGVL